MGTTTQQPKKKKKKTEIMKIYDCECLWSFVIAEANKKKTKTNSCTAQSTCVCDLKHVTENCEENSFAMDDDVDEG